MAGALKAVLFLCLTLVLVSEIPAASYRKKRDAASYTATFNLDTSHHTTDKRFLSVALGAAMCSRLHKFKITNEKFRPKLENLAKALSPSVVRIGGIKGNFNVLNPDNRTMPVTKGEIVTWEDMFHEDFWTGEVGKSDWSNINCTGDDITTLFKFFDTVGWSVMYQLNHMLRDADDLWDPYNTNLMLNHLDNEGINVEYFQLTNEPNCYSGNLGLDNDVDKVVNDFSILRNYLDNNAPERFKTAKVVGPDVSSRHGTRKSYLYRVLQAGLGQYIDALGIHHYYVDGRKAPVDDFLNSTVFDMMLTTTNNAQIAIDEQQYDLPFYLTETASAYAGGAPDLSNRYADTMIWLDELGLAALHRVSRVNRQTFWAGKYAIIDFKTYNPNPSFYISMLHKNLIEGAVINATVTPEGREVRVYAHCAKTDSVYNYPEGAIVVYYINLLDQDVDLNLDQFGGNDLDVFLFNKIDAASEKEALKSDVIQLNGQPIVMEGDVVPDLPPVSQTGPAVHVAPHSLGFVVVKDAQAPVCHEL